jgi:superfamily I DNA/RNA helicase
MPIWLIPRDELTPEQLRAIELSPNEHRVVFGAPGSGKTQVLLYRARYLMDTWKVDPERFRIFVFTNVLKNYIRAAVHLLNLPENCVMGFDKWCMDYYRAHIPGPLPMIDGVPNFSEIRQRVLEKLTRSRSPVPMFDFVLVDEGQDLDGNSFDILRAVARHLTVCIDHKQQIYERGSTKQDILKRLGLNQVNMSLLESFRCCPFIVKLSARLIDDAKEREAYLNQSRTFQTEKETPLLYLASDFEDEKRRLIEILRVRTLNQDESIAILLPTKRKVYGFAQGIREAGIEVETPKEMKFTNNLPKIMPYPSAKGLTFDTVLMPRLVQSSFSQIDASRVLRLLFVGITRATKWVYLSACQGQEITVLERLNSLAAESAMTIQTWSPTAPHKGRKPKNEEPGNPETGDILDLL